jgi:dienelactone hydrolase
VDYAERMRAAGNRRIKVKVYSGAHHGWESLGPVFDIRDAEIWSCCNNWIEDDGRHFVIAAGRDDYTPAPLALAYAERMRAAGNRRIKVKVYSGAHHGWESLGPVFDIRDAENWSCCRNFIEDDGRHFVVAAGRAMSEPEYQAWARINCVTLGARAGGGTPALKVRATADLLAFLAAQGFGVAKPPQPATICDAGDVSA